MRVLFLVLLLVIGACGRQGEVPGETVTADNNPVPVIYTVNYPLAWLAGELAGAAARVEFPVPAGEDPAFWRPDPDMIGRYQRADLVLLNGANYARWLGKVSLPGNRLLDTSAAYSGQLIREEKQRLHSHGPEGEHSHSEVAFTTWLDLSLLSLQAESVANALIRLLPEQAAAVDERRAMLQAQLADMDRELQAAADLVGPTPLLYSHPVYQYLGRRYGFIGVALHWESDQAPAEEEWARLRGLLAEHPAKWMLWEEEPLPEVADRLAQLDIGVIVFRPMGNRPPVGDFHGAMRGNIQRLVAAFERAAY
jgi:zinc transport system substrate-binding protein